MADVNWQNIAKLFTDGNSKYQMPGNGFSNIMNSTGTKSVGSMLSAANQAIPDYKAGDGSRYLAASQAMHQQNGSGNPIFDGVGQAVDMVGNIGLMIDKAIYNSNASNKRSLQEKIGLYADGGNLSNVGGVIGDVAGTVGALVGNAFDQAKIADTNSLQQGIVNNSLSPYKSGMTFDDLQSQWANTATLGKIRAKDLRPNSWGSDVINGVLAGNQGAQAGFNVGGGWGAVAGGVLGTASSIIGTLIGRHKASKEADRINNMAENQNLFNSRFLDNSAYNISRAGLDNDLANFSAFGGPITGAIDYANMMDYMTLKKQQVDKNLQYAEGGGIHIAPSKRGTFTAAANSRGLGVQEFASKVLANPDSYSEAMRKKAQFARNASKWHAFGGDLMTNGATWDDDFTYIGNGGTHEQNPHEGVQMGVDPNGTPNLVEEGEVVWNDYVFSKRLKVPKKFKEKYRLKGDDLSFADAATKFSKESEERPNDPISKKGRDALLSSLMDMQEEVRMKKQQREAKAQFNAMSPEEQMGIMQMAQQQAGEGLFAYGGNKFSNGKKMKKKKQDQDENISSYALPNVTVIANTDKPFLDPAALSSFHTPSPVITSYNKDNYIEILPTLQAQETFARDYEEERRREKMKDFLLGTEDFPYYADGGNLYPDGGDTGNTARRGKRWTWMRYAPIVGSGIGAIASLFDKPDYSSAEAIENAARRGGDYDRISANLISNYLTYNPFDINYTANQLRAAERANARSIMNTASGNAGNAMAGLLANNYNSQLAMGNAYRQAAEYNLAQREKVENFNRDTNKFNAESGMRADIANQQAAMDAARLNLSGVSTAAQLRDAEKARVQANRSANLTTFFDNLGALGQENYNLNDRDWYIRNVIGTLPEKPQYMSDAEWLKYQKARMEAISSLSKADGGMLTMDKKKKGGRHA